MVAEHVIEFSKKIIQRVELEGDTLHRIYYYDAEPLAAKKPKPLTGRSPGWSIVDFSSTEVYSSNIQLLEDLRKEPFFAVRLGELVFRGWSVRSNKLEPGGIRESLTIQSDDLIPNIQQKGVDLRVGLDIAALTLKHHVEIIILVTGDSDFVPALKFARREGMLVFLYTLGHDIHPELYSHADLWIGNSFEDL